MDRSTKNNYEKLLRRTYAYDVRNQVGRGLIASGYREGKAMIPDHLQGRVNSVFRLIAFGGQPLGIALTGILLQAYGPVVTVFLAFIPQVILAVAVTFNPHVRHARPVSAIEII